MYISKTVYSLYWPETRQVVESLWRSSPHEWYTDNYTKNQNNMHAPYLNGWREWVAQANVKLGKQLRHDYPTNGASEGIQHLMAYFATHDNRIGKPAIHVFEGEYEGYRKVAEALNLKVYTHSRHNYKESIDARHLNGDVFWTSQPSAIDGNVWPEFSEWVQWMNRNAAGMPIIVDLTYVGAVAREFEINLTSPNIKAVLWSLSKPFGVYYHRIGGMVSSIELPSLYGNYWFKNLFSLQLGTALMDAYGPYDLPRKYLARQETCINHVRMCPSHVCYSQMQLVPSDVVILAHQKFDPGLVFNDEYIRVKNNHEIVSRYCLTPGMDMDVNHKFIIEALHEKSNKAL
jgi:histidinol-phosphate/aromatic aminotransferase/cobyric acid decarboxylase-like protein